MISPNSPILAVENDFFAGALPLDDSEFDSVDELIREELPELSYNYKEKRYGI